MSLISPRCCFTSLCVYLVLLIILVLRIVAYSLLCDRLLNMTHSVLLYTSRSPYKAVVESLVVLQLDFLYSTAEVLEPIAEPLSFHPVWLFIFSLCGQYSTSLVPLFSWCSASSSALSTSITRLISNPAYVKADISGNVTNITYSAPPPS